MMAFKYLLLPFMLVSCGSSENSEKEEIVRTTTQLSNKLASDLYRELSSDDGNIIFSPFSISVALAMLYYGTKGETASEVKRVLGYDDSQLSDTELHSAFHSILKLYGTVSDQYELHVANALFAQKDFAIREDYSEAMRMLYRAKVNDVDFLRDGKKVVQDINDWVKKMTNDQISKFLDEVDPSTVLFILNAVYFKGIWEVPFDPEITMNGDFYNSGLDVLSASVPFMRITDEFMFTRRDDFRAIELPYKGKNISMVILLPEKRNGLPELEKSLQPNMISAIRDQMRKTRIRLLLPKFELEYEKNLNDVLKHVGLRNVFEDNADLSGISRSGNLVVSQVTHKAALKVNEEGSEASAITGIGIETRMGKFEIPFVVDHPFLFYIVDDRNDLILFEGRVKNL